MGKDSSIQWCDSTTNWQMGCDGCELWIPHRGILHCYAGSQTERRIGKGPLRGWPSAFDMPALFPERIEQALSWSDLTGRNRPQKPWLNGRPRVIFLNDMGDTFTESLPPDWLAPHLPKIASSPHLFLLLTKRAHRLRSFSERHSLPPNLWAGVSVTTQGSADARVPDLLATKAAVRFVSFEPLLEAISLRPEWLRASAIAWAIVGGESGKAARKCSIDWIRDGLAECREGKILPFVKQLGAQAVGPSCADRWCSHPDCGEEPLKLRDSHGGDETEWPKDLRVRMFPDVF